MKGLLIKDMKLILKSKRMIGCIVGVLAILLVVGNSKEYGFLIGYVAMLSSIFATSTISLDLADKSISFLMTLPITRSTYVKEKYLLMVFGGLFGSLLGAAACIFLQPGEIREILLTAVVIFAILLLMQMVMMPVHLKYGREKGLIVMLLIYAVVAGFFSAVSKINEQRVWINLATLDAAAKWLRSLNIWILGIFACLILLLCLAVSYHISNRIVRKLEF